MKYLIPFLTIMMFASCGNNQSAVTEDSQTNSDVEDVVEENELADVDEDIIDAETEGDMMIIQASSYHEGEILTEVDANDWVGLFKSGDRYYLEESVLSFNRVEDMGDDKGQKTGWEVSTENKDQNMLFMSGLKNDSEGDIKFSTLEKSQLYPGDLLSFSFLGNEYKLYATGQKVNNDGGGDPMVENYALFLTIDMDGEKRTQQLLSQPNFDDQMVSIQFVGDIDGDGILDLFIDNSRHYNVANPTLFLSKGATEGNIVREVASHLSVGC